MNIPDSDWEDWLLRRSRKRNAREGKPWFLSSAPVPAPKKHNPSRLRKCHRKIYYQAHNAPEEKPEPRGIFFLGRRIEQDLVLPFLGDVTGKDIYVGTDLDVYFSLNRGDVDLVFSGDTDPVLLDERGQPEAVTEVKTASTLPTNPRDHHLAQIYAYMYGMEDRYQQGGKVGYLIYVAREDLEMRSFRIDWDQSSWDEIVSWATQQTKFRREEDLPPANPEYDWECGMCPYRERCRQDMGTEEMAADVSYPHQKLREYVSARSEVTLPPAIARNHQTIVQRQDVSVRGWVCVGCDQTVAWDNDRVSTDAENPLCPHCADDGEINRLVPAE